MEITSSNKQHDRLTGTLSQRLALASGWSAREAERLKFAANLHDIGKAKIPDYILYKPGKLTLSEFEVVKLHTVYGYNLLQSVQGEAAYMMKQIAMFHHERYDGRGYWQVPREKQPRYIRIVTIADVFTALISERVYKPAWPISEALDYMEQNAGTQFDPVLVGLFVPLVKGGCEAEPTASL